MKKLRVITNGPSIHDVQVFLDETEITEVLRGLDIKIHVNGGFSVTAHIVPALVMDAEFEQDVVGFLLESAPS